MHLFSQEKLARNILLGKDGTPKISDFGMSRQLAMDATAGQTKSSVGPVPVRFSNEEQLVELFLIFVAYSGWLLRRCRVNSRVRAMCGPLVVFCSK